MSAAEFCQIADANVEDGTAVANAYLTNAGVITVGASAHASAGGPEYSAMTNTGVGKCQRAKWRPASGRSLTQAVSALQRTHQGL